MTNNLFVQYLKLQLVNISNYNFKSFKQKKKRFFILSTVVKEQA